MLITEGLASENNKGTANFFLELCFDIRKSKFAWA